MEASIGTFVIFIVLATTSGVLALLIHDKYLNKKRDDQNIAKKVGRPRKNNSQKSNDPENFLND